MNQDLPITGIPSALAQAGFGTSCWRSTTMTLSEVTGLDLASLRSLPSIDTGELTGAGLPVQVGQCKEGDPAVLCLGPAEWLMISEEKNAIPDFLRALETHCNGSLFSTDVSSGLAVIRLSGDGVPWLLSKLSGLDYLSGIHAGAHCARTRMGQAGVMVYFHPAPDGTEVFDLVLDRSLARYLWELLCASAPHADELVMDHGAAA